MRAGAFLGGVASRASKTEAIAGLLTLLLMAPAGCNWTTFAKDADKAPVRSLGAPDNFKAQDFGRSIFPLSDGLGKAAAFVATSINDPTLSIITLDAAGSASSSPVPGAALNETESSVISSVAEEAGTSPLKVIFGSPKVHNQGYGRVYSYSLSPMLEGNVNTLPVTSFVGPVPGLGRGLAVGQVAGAAKADYIVGSDDSVVVLIDGTTPTAPAVKAEGCDPTFDVVTLEPRYRLRRALLAARLWTDETGAGLQQIVSASPHAAITPGAVSFFAVTGTGAEATLTCVAAASAPLPEMRARFGASLATGDFNADGAADLLVGAPGQNAYVYFGPFPAGGLPVPVVIADSEGIDFGFAVAALNVDGRAGDEALVADPYATVAGKTQAGHVKAFRWNPTAGAMETYKTYADHSPQNNANFGSTVNALKFCSASPTPEAGMPCPAADTARVLVVGAGNEVFVYFREGDNIPMRADGDRPIFDVRPL